MNDLWNVDYFGDGPMVDDLSGIGGDSIGARNKKMQVEKKQ